MRYSYKQLLTITSVFFSTNLVFSIEISKNPLELEQQSYHSIQSKVFASSKVAEDQIEAGSEFDSLKNSSKNFKQSYSQGACILYSFLYGVSQNQKLCRDLENLLSKDEAGNYYVKGIKIPKRQLVNAAWDRHPSKEHVLRAIGEYVIKIMENELYIPHFENYVLTNWEACDLFFNKPIISIPYKEWIRSGIDKFQSDGSIKIGDTCYTGDFVVSWSRSGHARSMYFSDKKWQNYDNQIGIPYAITSGVLRSYNPDVDVMLIGDIKTEKLV